MGEFIDLSEYEKRIKERGKRKPLIEAEKEVLSLLKEGYSVSDIIQDLRDRGYSSDEIDTIISDATRMIKKRRRINISDLFFYGIVFLLIAAIVSIIFLQITTMPKDCGNDIFCAEKIAYCIEGRYTSSYAGVTREYSILNEGDTCRVFIETKEAPSYTMERKGMSMICVYPIVDGMTDTSDRTNRCEGSLVSVLDTIQ
ncbi:MAG: hypothetical protein J7K68_01210 [Candidatus Diapherotrites archaeon]|nr:hypothetical protein [Candidatus Diapherotrites archaeon]